jgi:hypothetical protein
MAKAYSAWVIEFRSKTSQGAWALLTPEDPAPKSLVTCEDEVRAYTDTPMGVPLMFRFRNIRSGETRSWPISD